jgi:PAS domain-containing protein
MRIYTRENGTIVDVSEQAAQLLNLSPRGLKGRPLPLFFLGNRDHVKRALKEAMRGERIAFDAVIRPREKRPVRVYVTADTEDGDTGTVRWQLTVDQRDRVT